MTDATDHRIFSAGLLSEEALHQISQRRTSCFGDLASEDYDGHVQPLDHIAEILFVNQTAELKITWILQICEPFQHRPVGNLICRFCSLKLTQDVQGTDMEKSTARSQAKWAQVSLYCVCSCADHRGWGGITGDVSGVGSDLEPVGKHWSCTKGHHSFFSSLVRGISCLLITAPSEKQLLDLENSRACSCVSALHCSGSTSHRIGWSIFRDALSDDFS